MFMMAEVYDDDEYEYENDDGHEEDSKYHTYWMSVVR